MTVQVSPQDEHLLIRAWTCNGNGYLKARIGGKNVYLHRIIAGAGQGEFVDHINGDKSDCRRENLRICSRRQSNQNRCARKDSKAPYKGITRSGKTRWLAQIMAGKQYFRIGVFATPEEAARAYDAAARRLHGEFARTNF